MNRRSAFACGLAVLLILSVAGIAWAQTPPAYESRWHVLSAGGSEGMSSEYHTVHSTLGQFAIGAAAGGRTAVGSGYWYGIQPSAAHRIYLPIIEHITAAR